MKLDLYKSIYKTYKEWDIFKRHSVIVLTVHNVKYSDDKFDIKLKEDVIEIKNNKGFFEIFDVEIDIQYVFVSEI